MSAVEPKPKTFEDVKLEVAKNLLKGKRADEKAKVDADALLAKVNAGQKLEELTMAQSESPEEGAISLPLRKETPWVLKTQESIPRIGLSKELHGALFNATAETPTLGQVYKVGQSYFVVQLKVRETPDMTQFEGEKEGLRSQALSTKRSKVFRDWVKFLRTRADIKLNPQLFGTQSAS
jgi:hypothetical protein